MKIYRIKIMIMQFFLIILLTIGITSIGLVNATPQGPNSINITSSGRNSANTAPLTMEAEAGNVTALVIDATTVTKSWQGYYGNITGTITLDDADNYTIYEWGLPNPKGEVYASNGSGVDWTSVYCINVTQNGTVLPRPGGAVSNINGTQIELNFGINLTDSDGLDETFNDTYTNTTGFRVGSITINHEDGCSLTHPYTQESYSDYWEELILSDNESLIFTALVKDNANDFKPSVTETSDFQMIVLENGHTGSEDTITLYYFYVELT